MRRSNNTYKVQVTIKEITIGACPQGHKPGDSWIIKDNQTAGGMCLSAFLAVFPAVRYFQYGEGNPWSGDEDSTLRCCPDQKHVVIYEVKRLH
ncbi:TIGR04076 family protein [Chloroflexota bacterium]